MESVINLPYRSSWSLLGANSFVGAASLAALLLFTYIIGNAVYSLTLYPLAGYPGPRWAAVSRIPWWYHAIGGNQIQWMRKLHSKYGSVVRFSPNDLSYVDHGGEAWKAVHSHAKGVEEFPKAKEWFVDTYNGKRVLGKEAQVFGS